MFNILLFCIICQFVMVVFYQGANKRSTWTMHCSCTLLDWAWIITWIRTRRRTESLDKIGRKVIYIKSRTRNLCKTRMVFGHPYKHFINVKDCHSCRGAQKSRIDISMFSVKGAGALMLPPLAVLSRYVADSSQQPLPQQRTIILTSWMALVIFRHKASDQLTLPDNVKTTSAVVKSMKPWILKFFMKYQLT